MRNSKRSVAKPKSSPGRRPSPAPDSTTARYLGGTAAARASRARDTAYVHAVADNVHQAVEDLTWDWSRERRQAWAIDTGTPTDQRRHPLEIEADKQAPAKLRTVLGRARLKVERDAMAATAHDQPDPNLRRQVANLDQHIQLLDQRLEPRRDPFARQPAWTPADTPTADRSISWSL